MDTKIIKKSGWWKYIPFAGDHTLTTLFGRIYVPEKYYPLDESDPLYIHESTHLRQQKEYGPMFYVRYLLSGRFRLNMEAEAYANQINWQLDILSPPKDQLRKLLLIDQYAKFLSDGTYGRIKYKDAAKKIEEYLG